MDDIDDVIERFKLRYVILTLTQLDIIKKFYDNPFEKSGYQDTYCIFDTDEGEVLLFAGESMRAKTFALKDKYSLSFLEELEVDKSYFYQCDKVKPNMGSKGVDKVYGIDHIWLSYIYHTKSNKKRMCINSNLFGRFHDINSREFNLQKLFD